MTTFADSSTSTPLFDKWDVLDSTYVDKNGVERLVFDPHDGQLIFMEDPARFLTCTCGRRFGKSNAIAHEFIPECLKAKTEATTLEANGQRREFWTVGPNYSDAEKPFRVFWDKCRALGIPFDKPGSYYSLEGGDMTVSCWDGKFIYSAKSAAVPERLVGEGLSGVHMEEAAKMKEIVWLQMIQPTLGDFKGWAKFTTTPEGKNWYYSLHMKALQPENLGWNAHRLPSWYNPHVHDQPTIDKDVRILTRYMNENPHLTSFEIVKELGLVIDPQIVQYANDNTLATFQQEYAAEFTDFVGKVFKDFDEEIHCRLLPFNPGWETVAAVDYGYRNPNVWLLIQIGPWGEINIVDELYQKDLAPDEFAHEILRRDLCPETLTEFYPDPASPGDTAVLENIFRRNGRRAIARGHTGGELDNRLNLIRLALKNRLTDHELSAAHWFGNKLRSPEGATNDDAARFGSSLRGGDIKRPQLMISTRCPETIREMGEYRYPKEKNEQVETSTKRYELPMKKDDHTPEALGRFLASRYHSAADQYGGGARVSRARFMSGGLRGRGSVGGQWYGDEAAGIPVRHTGKVRGTWNQQR